MLPACLCILRVHCKYVDQNAQIFVLLLLLLGILYLLQKCMVYHKVLMHLTVAAVPLQNTEQVPSYVMLGIPKPVEEPHVPPTPQRPLSPMGEACSRMDLTAIHQILFTTHYREDEWSNEVKEISALFSVVLLWMIDLWHLLSFSMLQLSFQEWTQ